MYAGHFAAALALKAAEPRVPTWSVLIGAGLLDILLGVLVLLGLEHLTVTPLTPPGFSLQFVDWSHSLLSSILLAALYGLAFFKRGTRVAAIAGLSVFSHFVLDYLMHPPDLALFPHSEAHLGLGWWVSLPTGSWVIELLLVAAGFAFYVSRGRREGSFAGNPVAIGITLLVLHLGFSPWAQQLLLK